MSDAVDTKLGGAEVGGLIGRKLGMTQVFTPAGELVPVTVIELGPCTVVATRQKARDGYVAAQIGFEPVKEGRVGKPARGHFAKAGTTPFRVLREVRVRLWAELGRTRMALGRAVGLAPGEVVELDAAVDDPVDIFVNGVRLGNGHLVVGDDGEWAFRVAEVSAGPVLDRALEGFDPSGAERTLVDREET